MTAIMFRIDYRQETVILMYLHLIHYRIITIQNFELFEHRFSCILQHHFRQHSLFGTNSMGSPGKCKQLKESRHLRCSNNEGCQSNLHVHLCPVPRCERKRRRPCGGSVKSETGGPHIQSYSTGIRWFPILETK